MKCCINPVLFPLLVTLVGCANDPRPQALQPPPDVILHNGKVVTVDGAGSTFEAVAVRDGRITALGSSDKLLVARGPNTSVVDLQGKTVIPGLIDSHVHPGAAMTEFDHDLPE